jgi:malonyl-CoA O-methyltransferase
MTPEDPILDRAEIQRSFARAAETYDAHAVLQREVGDRALSRLQYMQIEPKLILDLGAGTGYCARYLESNYKHSRIIVLDLALSMLQTARAQQTRRWFSRSHYLCGDACTLPIQTGSVDFIFSNLALQWCADLSVVFRECKRVLRPGGLLLFTTLGPDTLQELRRAWLAVDEQPHVNVFLDMHDVGDALIHAGFSAPVLDRELLTMTYANVFDLMRDLKGIGAQNNLASRRRGLTGKAAFAALSAAYESNRHNGVLPASYEIVYGHAWAPISTTRVQDGSTVATFPFKDLARRKP